VVLDFYTGFTGLNTSWGMDFLCVPNQVPGAQS